MEIKTPFGFLTRKGRLKGGMGTEIIELGGSL